MTGQSSEIIAAGGRQISTWADNVARSLLIPEPSPEEMRRMIARGRSAAAAQVEQLSEQDLQACAELYLHCLGFDVHQRTSSLGHERWALVRSDDGEQSGTAVFNAGSQGSLADEELKSVRFVVTPRVRATDGNASRRIGRAQIERLLTVAIVRELQAQFVSELHARPRLHDALVETMRDEYTTEFSKEFVARLESTLRA